jgi:hypothetical protein
MTIAELQPMRTVDSVEPRRPLTRDEVMTASEVAELLHLPISTCTNSPDNASFPRAGSDAHGDSYAQPSSTPTLVRADQAPAAW